MQKADNLVRRRISVFVTLLVLENLINCTTAACMWSTLCAFYQYKWKENIYMMKNSYFKNKMDRADTMNTHINKLVSMENFLRDLGKSIPQDMLIIKIIYSLQPS